MVGRSEPNQKCVYTRLEQYRGIQFDPDQDHVFWSEQILAVRSEPWSTGSFKHGIFIWIKLKSLKIKTKLGRCERPLSLKSKRVTNCKKQTTSLLLFYA